MRCSTAWRCSSAAWWCGPWQCGGRRHALIRRSSVAAVADERSRATADGRAKQLLLLLAQRHCPCIQRIQLATRLLATAADLWRGPLRRRLRRCRLVQRGSLSCVRCPLLRRSWRHLLAGTESTGTRHRFWRLFFWNLRVGTQYCHGTESIHRRAPYLCVWVCEGPRHRGVA